MSIVKIYARVLAQLAGERRLAIVLVFANLALACAQFVEPVLFGRIIDRLTNAQAQQRNPTWDELTPLLGAWVAFGLFSIGCAVLVALYADRLSHRRRLAVMAGFLRSSARIALELSWRNPFRPAAESHAGRGQRHGRHLAVVLPRKLRLHRRAGDPSAADAVRQLAAGVGCWWFWSSLSACSPPSSCAGPRACRPASKSYNAQAGRAGFGCAGQCAGHPVLHARRNRIARPARHHRQASRRAIAGSVVVGAGGGGDARLGHADAAVDLRDRRLAAFAGAGHHRRNRHLHEFRHHADRAAGADGRLRQLPVHAGSEDDASSSKCMDTQPNVADSPKRHGPRPAGRRSRLRACRLCL